MIPKVPPGRTAHGVWPPQPGSADMLWIVYLTDRRVRLPGLVLCIAGGIYAVAIAVWDPQLSRFMDAALLMLVGAFVQILGGSGYYPMDADGTIGDRISIWPPMLLLAGRSRTRAGKPGTALAAPVAHDPIDDACRVLRDRQRSDGMRHHRTGHPVDGPRPLLAVEIEPEFGQIVLSAPRGGTPEPGYVGDWADATVVSGTGTIFVATRPDDADPVAVRVYDTRPPLDGWSHVHTARLLVQPPGLTVGMTVSAVEYPIPVSAGEAMIEVWVRPVDSASDVTFVIQTPGATTTGPTPAGRRVR